jgi:hypothetical protein
MAEPMTAIPARAGIEEGRNLTPDQTETTDKVRAAQERRIPMALGIDRAEESGWRGRES